MKAARPYFLFLIALGLSFSSKAQYMSVAVSAGYDDYYIAPSVGIGVNLDGNYVLLNFGFAENVTLFGGETGFNLYYFGSDVSLLGGLGFGITFFDETVNGGARDLIGKAGIGIRISSLALMYKRSFIFPNEFSPTEEGQGNYFSIVAFF